MSSYHRSLLAGYSFCRRQGFPHSEQAIVALLQVEHQPLQSATATRSCKEYDGAQSRTKKRLNKHQR